jgi:hypothetical protein
VDRAALGRRRVPGAGAAHGEVAARRPQAELKTGVQADPLVQAVMSRFPGAKIVDVRAADQPAALPSGDPDELPMEPPPADDASYGADWIRDDEPEISRGVRWPIFWA